MTKGNKCYTLVIKRKHKKVKMIKIAEHRVQPYGTRGITLSFPRVYANDNDVDKGSEIMIFRTVINGIDVLVLVPKKNEETFNKTN